MVNAIRATAAGIIISTISMNMNCAARVDAGWQLEIIAFRDAWRDRYIMPVKRNV